MKQVMFVRPDSREDAKVWWCESDSQQVMALGGHQALNELATHPLASRICLLLPASETVFRHFTLAKKSQPAAFSWMAEETLIGDVDNLHWTVLKQKGCEVDAVAIDTDRLEQWLARFDEAGLKVIQVLPDGWLLPTEPGYSTLVPLEESYWLRTASAGACEVDATMLPLLLAKTADPVRCYGDAPEGVICSETLAWQHPLVLIQSGWKNSRVNLLHGEFGLRADAGAVKKIRLASAAMALLCVGLLTGPRVATAWLLVQEENLLQQEIVQLYQHHFPSVRQQTNIKYHFGQNLKKQKKGLFQQLEVLEQIKRDVPGMEIERVEYDNTQNSLTLSVKAQDPQQLQNFVQQASGNFAFTLQPISTSAPYTAMVTGKYK
ncbi:type II secretion system protein GspL [Leclercia adecarboxylata]|uniref:type II secretion system protein GspL n=1 Tax=Leclercia adecarboxylata TaxID=83655 RepID=UPI002DBA04DF|nr:type II secretion system protein GspL [Leclercia adecarboxylata]MEB6379133.1 type II secretion system protein GspL [Leclercia adecarboxylata]